MRARSATWTMVARSMGTVVSLEAMLARVLLALPSDDRSDARGPRALHAARGVDRRLRRRQERTGPDGAGSREPFGVTAGRCEPVGLAARDRRASERDAPEGDGGCPAARLP